MKVMAETAGNRFVRSEKSERERERRKKTLDRLGLIMSGQKSPSPSFLSFLHLWETIYFSLQLMDNHVESIPPFHYSLNCHPLSTSLSLFYFFYFFIFISCPDFSKNPSSHSLLHLFTLFSLSLLSQVEKWTCLFLIVVGALFPTVSLPLFFLLFSTFFFFTPLLHQHRQENKLLGIERERERFLREHESYLEWSVPAPDPADPNNSSSTCLS